MKRPSASASAAEDSANKNPAASPSGEADAAAGGGGGGGRNSLTTGGSAGGRSGNDTRTAMMTKRQALKQRNTKNVWPQHPKIQTMERREAAYLRVAGLPRAEPLVVTAPPSSPTTAWDATAADGPEFKFGRLLGGSDQRVRHRTVLQLRSYLTSKCRIDDDDNTGSGSGPGISELDLLKLWKALWHTLYLADKPSVQDELSRHLAQLLWCFVGTDEEDAYAGICYLGLFDTNEEDEDDDEEMEEEEEEECGDEDQSNDSEDDPEAFLEERVHELVEDDDDDDDVSSDNDIDDEDGVEDDTTVSHCRGAHLASLFVRTFFRTLRREWDKMDKYRVDKFYTLLRYMVREVYRYVALREWNAGIVALFNDALVEEALRWTPNGIRYHLIDVALDELVTVAAAVPSSSAGGGGGGATDADVAPLAISRPLTEATFLDLLEPYFALAQLGGAGPIGSESSDDTVQSRAIEKVLLRFLERHSVVRDDAALAESAEAFGVLDQVHVGTVAQFIFDLASDAGTKDKYRKSLYDVHKAYVRRLKRAGHDVDLCGEVAMSQSNPMDADEGESEEEEGHEETNPRGKTVGREPVATKSEEKPKRNKKSIKDPNAMSEEPTKSNNEKKDEFSKKESKITSNPKTRRKDDTKGVGPTGRKQLADKAEAEAAATVPENKKRQEQSVKQKLQDPSPFGNFWPVPKKRKCDPQSSAGGSARLVTEQELVITMQAQRAAKAQLQQREEAERRARRDESGRGRNGSADDGKRVKFRPENRSRSWTLSMKGLREMQSPGNSNVTPERGILLNKDAKIRKKSVNITQGKRRRAVDYF